MGDRYPSDWNSRRKKVYKRDSYIDAKSVVRWVANVVTQSFMLIIRNQFQKGIS